MTIEVLTELRIEIGQLTTTVQRLADEMVEQHQNLSACQADLHEVRRSLRILLATLADKAG